jgi:hypothetical protein
MKRFFIVVLLLLFPISITFGATYYKHSRGTAVNKSAAVGPCSNLSACMNKTVCDYGYVENYGSLWINNIATGNTLGFVGSGASGSDYNAEDDGNGAPGSNSRSGTTFTFADAANRDYHLTSGDAGAKDYGMGTTPKTYFTNDIDGGNRPATDGDWDIGADEV